MGFTERVTHDSTDDALTETAQAPALLSPPKLGWASNTVLWDRVVLHRPVGSCSS